MVELVREYDQLQSAQAERGWVLRVPAAVPTAGPSRPVARAAHTSTVGRGSKRRGRGSNRRGRGGAASAIRRRLRKEETAVVVVASVTGVELKRL